MFKLEPRFIRTVNRNGRGISKVWLNENVQKLYFIYNVDFAKTIT